MEILDTSGSTSIAHAHYEQKSRVLHVRFVGNDTDYKYLAVTAKEWSGLKKAESKGQYINFFIKPSHELGD